MEGIVVPEPQVLETNSEVEVNQLADVEQSNNVHSSESLVPNISSDVVSTGDVSMAAMAASPSENVLNEEKEDCSQGADLEQVSSSTESFTGQCRDVLPSVNHQMVVIPNMEPYLEDGSLDGTSKELQDPTSTNGNLAMEDNSNPDPTSNHVDSADPEVTLVHENREDNLESNLNSGACQHSEEVTINSDSTETALNNGTTPDDEQVASCSNQLIEKATPAISDDAPVIADTEEYGIASVPLTSEDVVPGNDSVGSELQTANVEPGIAEAESAEQFNSIDESATTHFTAGETYSEGDVINEDQSLVTSLSQTEMTSHSEVSNSVADCTTEANCNEMEHGENAPESACQLLEVNEGLGEAAVLESDFADSSTLEIEERELVATDAEASEIQPEDLNGIPDPETSESFAVVEPEHLENGICVPEVVTVDSSVDDTIQEHVDRTPLEGTSSTLVCGSYESECIEGGNVEENVEANQADSGVPESDFVDGGATESDFVDGGTAEGDFVDGGTTEGDFVVIGAVESELVNEEAMETDQIQAGTIENDAPTVEADPIDEQVGEPDESQGITLENPVATEQGEVIYGDPVESGTIEEESTEAQSVDTQLMEAHLIGAQPVEVRQGDEGVDSSYYMNSVDIEQPDGAIVEGVEASADLENPTSSHLETNYGDNEVENSELINMDTNMSNPTAVCEADSSAAGMEEPAYETQQMVDTQNVYVVEDGRLTLNSVQPSNSINNYHNAENAMLVEMAPLSTDGSYVDSQVSYVDAGQEGMITDAQAAELLMRVSEHRPMSLQSLQQDSSSSSGPYVQVQLAQTVDGITHLVEVPVSALAGYGLSSTLVYSTSGGGNSGSGGSDMNTWVQMHENANNMEQHHLRTENKFSDIVSASIEAIGFPESSTPGANILSQAEQILIASENAAQESAAAAAASSNFEFDESSNSSITLINDKATTSYPRPKRESIESRIHKLLRGANAPALEVIEEPMQIPGKASPRNVKLGPVQSPKPAVSSTASSPATVTLSLSPNQMKKPGRLVTATNSMGRTVTIPTVFTATNQSANKAPASSLPPGSVDYFMPRGVSKRKAQTFKASKVNASNPNSIDVEPAPPEETQVKLAMGVDMLDEDDLHKDDDDFNRAVLLQARQRLQSEQGTNYNKFSGHSSSSVHLSLPSGTIKVEEEDMTPAKRVRLSFPPEKYANLESVSSSYMADLQTPKLTYTIPRTRQVRPKIIKEAVSIDNSPKPEKEISVRLPWMEDEEELKRKRTPPRIIRQTIAAESKPREVDVTTFDIDPDSEQSDQVIVIGLDETGQQPSEEQLTAIIQAAMRKRETLVPERPTPPRPSPAPVANVNTPKSYSMKRKAVDDENGVETEENGVRLKVIRTYDRGLGTPRKRPPRSKKLSTFLEIFEFDEDEEEEEDEEEVDDLERFSQALVDEENAIREKEGQPKKPVASASKNAAVSTATYSRGRGRGRGRAASHGSGLRQTPDAPGTIASPAVRGSRSRGRPPRGSKISFRSKIKDENSEDDYVAYEDDEDDDYKPRGRGRGRGRGQSRGKRGRPRSVSREEPVVEAQEEEEEDEARIPGMPSKPCPQCDERFTTREGFLDHIVVHSSANCLMEMCDWVNPASKEKTARLKREQLKQHMLSVHSESIPTA